MFVSSGYPHAEGLDIHPSLGLGLGEGLTDGLTDGLEEGLEEGLAEGLGDGESEGLADGLGESDGEGLADGEGAGANALAHVFSHSVCCGVRGLLVSARRAKQTLRIASSSPSETELAELGMKVVAPAIATKTPAAIADAARRKCFGTFIASPLDHETE